MGACGCVVCARGCACAWVCGVYAHGCVRVGVHVCAWVCLCMGCGVCARGCAGCARGCACDVCTWVCACADGCAVCVRVGGGVHGCACVWLVCMCTCVCICVCVPGVRYVRIGVRVHGCACVCGVCALVHMGVQCVGVEGVCARCVWWVCVCAHGVRVLMGVRVCVCMGV